MNLLTNGFFKDVPSNFLYDIYSIYIISLLIGLYVYTTVQKFGVGKIFVLFFKQVQTVLTSVIRI